eukprot:gene19891-25846_t
MTEEVASINEIAIDVINNDVVLI